jgi:hypothetical protein
MHVMLAAYSVIREQRRYKYYTFGLCSLLVNGLC